MKHVDNHQGSVVKKFVQLIFLSLLLCGCKEKGPDTVTFLGVNSKGLVVRHYLNHFAAKKMVKVLGQSSNEVVEGLEEVSLRRKNLWSLSRITVGLQLQAGFEVLDILELKSEGALEMRFEPIANNKI
jgi:hypothetical protein